MKTALFKNTFREIKNTKARFISIMMIVALGVGFFVGIKTTPPSMEQMAVDYYKDTNLMDFRLLSTVGFDDDDVAQIKDTDGVGGIMPAQFLDVSVSSGDTGRILRLLSVPSPYDENDSISNVVLVDGRLPEKEGEIAVESSNFGAYKLGDTIKIDEKAGQTDVTESLSTLEYTVVGLVKSPIYISLERGTTTVGNGSIDEFAYVAGDSFTLDRYTVVYATLDTNGENISPFTDEYDQLVDTVTKNLEDTSDVRVDVFTKENIDKAQKEIDDNTKELEDKKSEAEKEFSDAEAEITKGEQEYYSQINSAQAEIDNAQAEIDSGRAELETQWAEYEQAVSLFNTQMNEAKEQLLLSQTEYEESCAQVESLKDTKATLESEVVNAATLTIYGIVAYLPADADSSVADTLNSYAASVTVDNAVSVLNDVKDYLNTVYPSVYDSQIDQTLAGIVTMQENIADLNDGIAQGEAGLTVAYEQLSKAQQELELQETQTNKELALYRAELENAEEELNAGAQTLENTRAQLESAKVSEKKEINDGKAELEKQKAKADKEFAKAEKKLSEAQAKLDEIDDIEWYVFDRDDNPGYSGFIENTNRVDAVATVFPLFFLLVAMLVCLTTMTRLVEEKRTEIGTLKALGYSDRSITFKFVVYACLAAVFGCVIGCLSCIPTLPRVIYNAYGMLYNMRDLKIVVAKGSLIIAVLSAFACCALVTFGVCYKNLMHKPATLMRPKAPKAGKRILLERIPALWKHLNFSSKVTWRNLFRYKSRLFMTAIGIAGCTALMVAAFGLYNSINDVIGLQFNQLCNYNAIIVSDKEKPYDDMTELLDTINSDERFELSTLAWQKAISIASEDTSIDSDVNLTVAQNAQEFESLINLRNRISGDKITLSDDGVVLSEKLADKLKVDVGDTVYVGDSKDEVTVVGVTENYVSNYVYMSEKGYTKMTGEQALYNMVYTYANDLTENSQKQISTEYLENSDVAAVSFTSDIISDFRDMVNSLNIVVLVMVISAGALAIVVLYNLTNINLAERNREIATIKVLGFNHKETSAFVYRENIILTILGILIGLVLGVWLWQFVVQTVEIDTIMFGKQIHLLSYILAATLTGLFSLLVNMIMYFRIKAINMVESLKSIE